MLNWRHRNFPNLHVYIYRSANQKIFRKNKGGRIQPPSGRGLTYFGEIFDNKEACEKRNRSMRENEAQIKKHIKELGKRWTAYFQGQLLPDFCYGS